MTLSLGERLANERAKRTHISDLKHPLVAALAWLREKQEARERFMESNRSDAQAEYDMDYARQAQARALTRWRNGFDRQVSIAERGFSRNTHEAA